MRKRKLKSSKKNLWHQSLKTVTNSEKTAGYEQLGEAPTPGATGPSRPRSPKRRAADVFLSEPCHPLPALKPLSYRLRPCVSLRGPPGREQSPCVWEEENRKARGRASRKTCLPTAAGSLGENRARATKAARLRSWAQAGEDRKMVAGAFWFR